MSDTALTWPDGTKRSTGYPFVWQVQKEVPKAPKRPLTKEQEQEEKNRRDTLARWHLKQAKAKAERVNPEAKTASFIPKSTRAPR
jgi:hypothetical protein